MSNFNSVDRSYGNNIHIDSLNAASKNDLYSPWGNIEVKGTAAEKLRFQSATARHHIKVANVVIQGHVLSEFGTILSNQSTLGHVTARHNIDLIDSSTAHVLSEFGAVVANQSTLGSVTARHSIDLINSSATDLLAEFGDVFVNQSTLEKITARHNIDVLNSSAKALLSEFGHVIVRQTDGIQRTITHITAHDELIAENSLVDNLILYVNSDKRAFLDLTNTKISENIVIKIDGTYSKMQKIVINLFNWSFWSRKENTDNSSKHFSLLIKGKEMPKNIIFEGFQADEITSQATDEGILVTGRKKTTVL